MRVAVYGTLRKGFNNHHLLLSAKFVSEMILPGFDMYSMGGFPACAFGSGKIYAEIYDVDKPTLDRLDRLEGHPDWYERKCVPTILGDIWIYTYTKKQCENLDLVHNEEGIAIWN